MSETVTLKGELRTEVGTGFARELRRQGKIPAILYGSGKEPVAVTLEEKEVTKLYRRHGFTTTVVVIEAGSEKFTVLPKSVDLHPITDLVRHADFVFVADKGTQRVEVPLVFDGKERSVGVKRGGFFNIIHRKVALNCPVQDIPLNVTIDVSNMTIGSSLRARKLTLPEGCSLVAKSDFVIASITGRGGKSAAAEDSAEK